MAESWKQFGKLRLKELPSFAKRMSLGKPGRVHMDGVLQLQQEIYPDGEHQASQPRPAFGRFALVRCGMAHRAASFASR